MRMITDETNAVSSSRVAAASRTLTQRQAWVDLRRCITSAACCSWPGEYVAVREIVRYHEHTNAPVICGSLPLNVHDAY